jgi:hypothetical protein
MTGERRKVPAAWSSPTVSSEATSQEPPGWRLRSPMSSGFRCPSRTVTVGSLKCGLMTTCSTQTGANVGALLGSRK